MKKILILLITGCFSIASAQTATDLTKIKKDVKFAKCAAKDGLMEVKLGQLAQTNAMTPEVKAHASHMVEDHANANGELRSIATKKDILLVDSLNKKQQKHYNKLSTLKGKDFDKKYSKCMVKDHKKAICEFKKEAKKGKDPELKAWANGKVPTLKSHLQMWKDACKAIKNS